MNWATEMEEWKAKQIAAGKAVAVSTRKDGYAAPPGTGPANETCRSCKHYYRRQMAGETREGNKMSEPFNKNEIYVCGHTRKCKWKGLLSEQKQRRDEIGYTYICPRCGNDSFYVRERKKGELISSEMPKDQTPQEVIQALTTCRDHWKTSFEHERENVIRLRGLVARLHSRQLGGTKCVCHECEIFHQHSAQQPATPEVQAIRDWIAEVQRLAIQKYEFTPDKAAATNWRATLAEYYLQNYSPDAALAAYITESH